MSSKTELTREEKIEALINRDIEKAIYSNAVMYEIFLYGLKGYDNSSNEQIDSDYEVFIIGDR